LLLCVVETRELASNLCQPHLAGEVALPVKNIIKWYKLAA